MQATLSNHNQSVRKAKLIADLVRGKNVIDVQHTLSFTDKKAAAAFKKLIASAVANARQAGVSEDRLFIKEVMVNKGVTFTRYMPQARGRASAIERGRSHIKVVLGARGGVEKKKEDAVAKKTAKKVTKKVAKKKTV